LQDREIESRGREGSQETEEQSGAYIQRPLTWLMAARAEGWRGEKAIGLTMGRGIVGAQRMGSMFVGNAKTHLHAFRGVLEAVNKRGGKPTH